MTDTQLVTIARFSNGVEAEIARTRLESEEIPAWVADATTVNANWFLSQALGGVRLQVLSSDEAAAREILGAYCEPEPEDSSWGYCNQCGSKELDPVSSHLGTLATFLLLGLPLLLPRRRFRCRACGQEQKTS